jgi:hypothetical protein
MVIIAAIKERFARDFIVLGVARTMDYYATDL